MSANRELLGEQLGPGIYRASENSKVAIAIISKWHPAPCIEHITSSCTARSTMARALSNLLLKGITGSPAECSKRMVSASIIQRGMRYSTTAPNDSETHDDFKPMDKFQDSASSLKDVVEKDVKENPVMIYMKGVPEYPQCGFSSLAVRVLKHYNAPLSARNILENAELKSAVKAFSHWPTFPQIFIKGEFIGGSDIIMNMHQSGELKEKLKDIGTSEEKSA